MSGRGRELAIPPSRQQEAWTCGPAALRSVLAYHGVRRTERHLARLCGASEGLGTTPEALLLVARRYGVEGEQRQGWSLEGLRTEVAAGRPAIVLLQAWAEGRPPARYLGSEADGHYVVCTAVGERRLVFADPSLGGARATLTCSAFLRRWHDRSYEDGRGYDRWALVFEGLGEGTRWRRVGRVARMG